MLLLWLVIEQVAPELAARLRPGGKVVAAGLIETQERDVVEALRAVGLFPVERTQEKDWVALVTQRR